MPLTQQGEDSAKKRTRVQICQCGCRHFQVSRPHLDKQMLSVRCAVCGAFYAYLIPDFGIEGHWRVVCQN